MIILEFNQFRPTNIERNQISFESTYLAANKCPPDSTPDRSKFVNIEFPYQLRRNWFHVFNVFFSSEQLVSEESLHLSSQSGEQFRRACYVHSTSIVVKKCKLNGSQNIRSSIRWNPGLLSALECVSQ